MDMAKRAIEILRDAERRLRGLVGEAAAGGEYDLAMRITEWARCLGSLPGTQVIEGAASHGDVADVSAVKVGQTAGSPLHTARTTGKPRKGPKPKEYPIFLRQGDVLIKVGWSKSQDSTYEHRAPKQVLDAVVRRTIVAAKQTETPFTAESLSDIREQDDDVEVPGYQLYLCLAWLKRCKLIRQHGRQGYSLVNPGNLVRSVEEKWIGLPRQTV